MEKENGLTFSIEEKEKLISLLKYASDAIEYWFDGCDVNEEDMNENIQKRNDCEYFINKLIREE